MKLATGTKMQVHLWVRACAFDFNGMPTATHLNVGIIHYVVGNGLVVSS